MSMIADNTVRKDPTGWDVLISRIGTLEGGIITIGGKVLMLKRNLLGPEPSKAVDSKSMGDKPAPQSFTEDLSRRITDLQEMTLSIIEDIQTIQNGHY